MDDLRYIFRLKKDYIKDYSYGFFKDFYAENGNLDILVDKSELFDLTEEIKDVCESLGQKLKIRLIVDNNLKETDANDNPYIYDKSEVEKLTELNNSLTKIPNFEEFGFLEYAGDATTFHSYIEKKDVWDLEQVLFANNKLNTVVENIKDLNLSPFETMLCIHDYVSNSFKYESTGHRKSEATIMGAYIGEGFVCAGMTSLIKAIVDRLNIPGLSCERVSAEIYEKPTSNKIRKRKSDIIEGKKDDKNFIKMFPNLRDSVSILSKIDYQLYKQYKKYGEFDRHALCLIHLNDEKYGINGYYLNDATWDNKDESFAGCCYPIEDVLNFRDQMFFIQLEDKLWTNKIVKKIDRESFLRACMKSAKNQKKGKEMPYVVREYGKNSKPIDKETFEKAFTTVCESLDFEDVNDRVKGFLKNSEVYSTLRFNSKAQNSFVLKNVEAKKDAKSIKDNSFEKIMEK